MTQHQPEDDFKVFQRQTLWNINLYMFVWELFGESYWWTTFFSSLNISTFWSALCWIVGFLALYLSYSVSQMNTCVLLSKLTNCYSQITPVWEDSWRDYISAMIGIFGITHHISTYSPALSWDVVVYCSVTCYFPYAVLKLKSTIKKIISSSRLLRWQKRSTRKEVRWKCTNAFFSIENRIRNNYRHRNSEVT